MHLIDILGMLNPQKYLISGKYRTAYS